MGIINVTPDSFYDGGTYSKTVQSTIRHALKLVEDGADIIDIGGESSRPGAKPISESEEIDRILPIIEGIRKQSDVKISVDTYKPKVAHQALKAGVDWVNDITGLKNNDMLDVVNSFKCPVIVMHIQGNPQTMQTNPKYKDVIREILDFFESKIKLLHQNNVDQIILDPGIGFGKTVDHNLQILREIEKFKTFELPVLVGVSRKSFIGKVLKQTVENRLTGSLAVLSWLTTKEIEFIRVHDVKESFETIKMITKIKQKNN